jgi:hypothetical protein
MNYISFNKGSIFVFASAIIGALSMSHFYEGDYGALILVQVMSYVCVFLEYTLNFRPRVSGVIPLILIIVPVGGYLTYQQKGTTSLVAYVFSIALIYLIANRWQKRTGNKPAVATTDQVAPDFDIRQK